MGADSRFVYDEGWTQEIACALPIVKREHFWRNGLIPFFEHLGPEGWLRGRQARAGHTTDQDDFGLLLNFGVDCIGAVGIVAENGAHVSPLNDADPVEEAATAPGRTLSGVQKKWLVHRRDNAFEPAHRLEEPATHIAKFNRQDEPTLVQNEDLSLRLAREVLGPEEVTRANIGTVRGADGIALIVERFDRSGSEKLRLEDFAQILDRPRGREFEGKYQSSYEEAADVVSRFSSRATIDLARFYRLVVFNLVIGNADAHLKNFSLLETGTGLRLSPAYDLLNTVVYPRYERDTALAIEGAKRPLDSVDHDLVVELGHSIGLKPRAVKAALDTLCDRFARAGALGLPPNVEPDDIRARYRDIVAANADRIFR